MTGGPSPDLRRRFWRVVRIGSGCLLVAVGVVGLFLPVLQGIAFIFAGLTVLAADLPWAKRLLLTLRQRLRWGRAPGGSAPEAQPAPKGDAHDAQHRDQAG
jgi:hypothetical protein